MHLREGEEGGGEETGGRGDGHVYAHMMHELWIG